MADKTLAIADEDDLIVTVSKNDLVNALTFLRTTIEGFGADDVADYLGKTHDETYALSARLQEVVDALLDS